MFGFDDDGPSWTFSRVISGMVAGFYLALAGLSPQPGSVLRMLLFCVLPVSCIWFATEMGSYIGRWFSWPQKVGGTSPPSIVAFLGWILLLMPGVLRLWMLLAR